jgi:hypothetical protein
MGVQPIDSEAATSAVVSGSDLAGQCFPCTHTYSLVMAVSCLFENVAQTQLDEELGFAPIRLCACECV